MRFLATLAFAISLLASSNAFSHVGGHGHHYHGHNARTWTLESGDRFTSGTFLMIKNGEVYVESTDGEVKHVSMSSLSPKDKEFAKAKQSKIDAINSEHARLIAEARSAKQATQHSTTPAKSGSESIWGTLEYSLLAISVVGLFTLGFFSRKFSKRQVQVLRIGGVATLSALAVVSCKKKYFKPMSSDPATIEEAFVPYGNVNTWSDENYVYVESNGLAGHEMMTGITAWIAQVPLPQDYYGSNAWAIPLTTQFSEDPVSITDDLRRGAIGIAANGIPIFNPVNASGLISKDIGELDPYGGHSGRADDYHYHAAPLHLEATSGNLPIGYAFDGYAIYGSTEPDGRAMEDLDEFHGHIGDDGAYHYHGTDSYPFLFEKMRGVVTLEGTSPETQIIPQATTQMLRDPLHPINGNNLLITGCDPKTGVDGYRLDYTIGGVPGAVDYDWDANGLFTFRFYDINGDTTIEQWQR